MSAYIEDTYERAVVELLEGIGWENVDVNDIEREFDEPLDLEEVRMRMTMLNRDLPAIAVNEALQKVRNIEMANLVKRNAVFTNYLQRGVEVTYTVAGQKKAALVKLVDFADRSRNSFRVVRQWKMRGFANKRFDLLFLLNGFPVAIAELKSPTSETAEITDAYLQLRNYMQDVPETFVFNQLCVISNQMHSRVGTITSGEDRFMEWKTSDGRREENGLANFGVFFTGIFEPTRLLDILKNFVCFVESGTQAYKILSGYHQYYAVRKAIESTRHAVAEGTKKAGVFWHTQGSGKSLSMVFYAHLLHEAVDSPTIVVITDRNDLDKQLFAQFEKCSDFLRQRPVQAESCQHLHDYLEGQKVNGIIFTTMQKFTDYGKALSERKNIVVMADEAHRSQYGLTERIKIEVDADGNETAKSVQGVARIIRNTMPNATFIGFTGTPISRKDRSTTEVFGDYIDVYDMTQAVDDGAVLPIYYESRAVNLKLDADVLREIDEFYNAAAETTDAALIEKSKHSLGQMDAILGNESTLNLLVDDILKHYEENREGLLTGKAMIVAYSRQIAWRIMELIAEKRPNWPKDKVAIVMTESNQDPEEWRKTIGTKAHRADLAAKFKDDTSALKIVIVVDMWLTGFDVPSLATMYLYKPMKEHNLMQAIARVNRVYANKEGGLIVDYVGIASALKQAMAEYTKRDQQKFPSMDVAKNLYAQFQERLQICKDIFAKFDYSGFLHGTALQKANAITGGVDFIMDPAKEKDRDDFLKAATGMMQAQSLCSSLTTPEERMLAAFFNPIRISVSHIEGGHGGKKSLSLKELNENVNALLKQSVKSEGVQTIFSVSEGGYSIFDKDFIGRVAKMKSKNLLAAVLKRLVEDKISVYKRSNVVRSAKFSELMQKLMNKYQNGQISNEQVIRELLALAKEMMDGAVTSGLTESEQAFYDALTKPRAVKDFYTHDQLVGLTRELVDRLRKNQVIDWQFREDARASMRWEVKKLLKKYKYPPEEEEGAVDTVIRQCELWADNTPVQAGGAAAPASDAKEQPQEDTLSDIFAMFDGIDLSGVGEAAVEDTAVTEEPAAETPAKPVFGKPVGPGTEKPTDTAFDTSDDPFAMFTMAADDNVTPDKPENT